VIAGRKYEEADPKTQQPKEFIFLESIDSLEEDLKTAETSLSAARDPVRDATPANPYQTAWTPRGNVLERNMIRGRLLEG
jgi:hypothetical protein